MAAAARAAAARLGPQLAVPDGHDADPGGPLPRPRGRGPVSASLRAQDGEARGEGERRSFSAGGILYEQGQRDAPFFVLESGRVELVDRKPGKEVWIVVGGGNSAGQAATHLARHARSVKVAVRLRGFLVERRWLRAAP